jgi:hypothetical protein
VQEVDPCGVEVHAIEQVPPHERVIAARIVRRDAQELVEIEGGGLPENRRGPARGACASSS